MISIYSYKSNGIKGYMRPNRGDIRYNELLYSYICMAPLCLAAARGESSLRDAQAGAQPLAFCYSTVTEKQCLHCPPTEYRCFCIKGANFSCFFVFL